jgi:hypothetical protein
LIITVIGIGELEKERASQNDMEKKGKNLYPSTPFWEGAFWAK